jgi:hypothetical protein
MIVGLFSSPVFVVLFLYFLTFCLVFGGTGVLALAKQALYILSHTFSPFYSGYLEMGLRTIFPG